MDLTNAIADVAFTAALSALRAPHAPIAFDFLSSVTGFDIGKGGLDLPGGIAARHAPYAAPSAPADAQKPVFQLATFPLAINPASFVNPATNINPNGSYTALYAFRALVDPVPNFARYYLPAAGASTEMLWGDFVNGASVRGEAGFAQLALARAQQNFSQYALNNLSGGPGQWRPVYAAPEDWFDFDVQGRFVDFEIDLGNPDTTQTPFATIAGSPPASLSWLIARPGAHAAPLGLDPKTRLKNLRAKALVVAFSRPWLDIGLFQTTGVYLQGQSRGLYSSGDLAVNRGLLPLLPAAFCLATDIQIEADWAGTDMHVLTQAAQNSARVVLGQFALSSGAAAPGLPRYTATFKDGVVSSPAVQIIGWISALVPLCPQSAG